MIASNMAIAKAQQSTEKRFDQMSENRQRLDDLQAKNIACPEVEQ
jgi:hypothetical protein